MNEKDQKLGMDLLEIARNLEKIAFQILDQPVKRGSMKAWSKYQLRSLPKMRQGIVRILARESGLEMSTKEIADQLGISNMRSISGAMSGFTQQSMSNKLDELVIKTKREGRQSYWKLNPNYRELAITELK